MISSRCGEAAILVVGLLFPLAAANGGVEGYLEPGACAPCHREIARSYAGTSMAKSFGIVRLDTPVPAIEGGEFRHEPSAEFFSIPKRDGIASLRRHQLDFDGSIGSIFEKRLAFWIGSGSHARSYIGRTSAQELVELPITWYAESGGHWAMSPAYDRPDHPGFSRRITERCLFCHNAYPQIEQRSDSWDRPVKLATLPEGIDCQRCHGPGQDHVNAARSGEKPEAVRRAILNPSRLPSDRRMEVCLQCHLETTNLRLPGSLPRYDRSVFSYRPGQPLENQTLYFDHAPGTGYDDKFEFSSAPYRLRKSACFLASQGSLQCTTCHNPHTPAKASSEPCQKCHRSALAVRIRDRRHPASQECISCHMPQRRPSDAIHVTVTDHFIRRNPATDPTAAPVERHDNNSPPYRGPVVLYYPPSLPDSSEKELYLAVAQIKNQANLQPGLQRLEAAIARYSPERAKFYLELADGFRHAGRVDKAAPAYEAAAARAPGEWRAFYGLGLTLPPPRAEQALKRAMSLAPQEIAPLQALARAQSQQGKTREAIATLENASALDPESAELRNDLGTALFRAHKYAAAENSFREAVRLRPEIASIHVNLAEVLSRRGGFEEAKHHFERAVFLDPSQASAHSSYGTALAANRHFAEARKQYEAALRINPNLPVTLNNLAVALVGLGRLAEAEESLQNAIRIAPDYGEAHLELARLLLRRGDKESASPHLIQAAQSPDLQISAAAKALQAAQ